MRPCPSGKNPPKRNPKRKNRKKKAGRKTQTALSERHRLAGRSARGCAVSRAQIRDRLLFLLYFINFLYLLNPSNAIAPIQPPTTYALTHPKIFTLPSRPIEH